MLEVNQPSGSNPLLEVDQQPGSQATIDPLRAMCIAYLYVSLEMSPKDKETPGHSFSALHWCLFQKVKTTDMTKPS